MSWKGWSVEDRWHMSYWIYFILQIYLVQQENKKDVGKNKDNVIYMVIEDVYNGICTCEIYIFIKEINT